MESCDSQIVFAALYLREASKELEFVEPEMSLALLKSAEAILKKHRIGEDAVAELGDLSNGLKASK